LPWLGRKLQAIVNARGGFYQEMLSLLASEGLEKPATVTPRQYALAAAELLRQHPATADVATVPVRIVDLFYRVRFGHYPLTDQELHEVDQLLERLAEALRRNGQR
jgi:hypothetical protein